MYRPRRYDAFASQIWCIAALPQNDAMFAFSLGEADIIHEVHIISEASSFAEGKHH